MRLKLNTDWLSKVVQGLIVVSGFVFLSSDLPALSKVEPGTRIAWGGVGNYGIGGYGYGRLARMGYRGIRRGYSYGSGRRRGQFTHNYNRMNNMGNGYLRGGSYGGNSAQSSQLWGRAQGRFNKRHSNNELWNRGTSQGWGNSLENGGNQTHWGSGGSSMGRGRGYGLGGMQGGEMQGGMRRGGGRPGGEMQGGEMQGGMRRGAGMQGGGRPGGGMSDGGMQRGGAAGGGW